MTLECTERALRMGQALERLAIMGGSVDQHLVSVHGHHVPYVEGDPDSLCDAITRAWQVSGRQRASDRWMRLVADVEQGEG